VPPSPSRIAPASPAHRSGSSTPFYELLPALADGGVPVRHERPVDAPPERSSTASTAMAGRSTLPPESGTEQPHFHADLEDSFRAVEAHRTRRALDARTPFEPTAVWDRVFGNGASETGHPQEVAAAHQETESESELDNEIQPRSPAQQTGTLRPRLEVGLETGETPSPKRRAFDAVPATNASPVGSGPVADIAVRDPDDNDSSGNPPAAIAASRTAAARLQAPEAAKVWELAERVMSENLRRTCENLGVLLSAKHPGIPESMHKPLHQLVCQEWDRAFGPQAHAQVVGPLCPTIEDLRVKSRLQAVYMSTRLLDEGKLRQLPPGMVGRGERVPAATAPIRQWNSYSSQARNTLSLICAAKANGMTDAEVTTFAKEKVSARTFAFMRRMAHSGESNLAMVHEFYRLDSASLERRRSTPRLNTNQNCRAAVVALIEAFEKKYGDPGPSGVAARAAQREWLPPIRRPASTAPGPVAARAALREWLPPSLKKLLPESDNPARLEMATLLMEAANAGRETLENVCSYLIMATDAPPMQRSGLMAIAKRGSELVKLRDRLQRSPAP
jgi:hypothetical protein